MHLPRRPPSLRLYWLMACGVAAGAAGIGRAKPDAAPHAELVSLSGRSRVDSNGPQAVTVVCEGPSPRPVLLRAIGRGLPAGFGANALPTPVLTLVQSGHVIARDQGSAIAEDMAALAQAAGTFPVGPPGRPAFASYGAAIAPKLGRGAYEITTVSGDRGGGIALFELHALGPADGRSFVRRVSFRGQTGPGDALLVVGFVIRGDGLLPLLLRGEGPASRAQGDAPVTALPRLELYAAGASTPLVCSEAPAARIAMPDPGRHLGELLPPAPRHDAATLVTLAPGTYTVQLTVASQASGLALLELSVLD